VSNVHNLHSQATDQQDHGAENSPTSGMQVRTAAPSDAAGRRGMARGIGQ
jgi:hypothetical protein